MNLENDLNQEQHEAVMVLGQPLLIIAGAGSGKTRVITYKIAYLISQGIKASNILALTFTNKAAAEMKDRAMKLCHEARHSEISTFHALCAKILRSEIEILGYANNFSIINRNDSLDIIKSCLKELNLEEDPKKVLTVISNSKGELIELEDFCKYLGDDFRAKKNSSIYELYQVKLKQENLLDFDDIIKLVVKIFKNHKEILAKYQARYKYILIDEYQDTNTAQYVLIKLLCGESDNICVVGDDDQSIYGWRGANIRNILDFEKEFNNTKIIKLEQNYRSSQFILDAANSVIQNNSNRKEKNLWSENKSPGQIVLFHGQYGAEGAEFITQEILDNLDFLSYGNYAILYRNNFQSRVLEDKLIEKNIPYKIVGAIKFYERMEIKDLLAYLKLINNPNDEIAFTRAIGVPKRGVGTKTLDQLGDIARTENISKFNAIPLMPNKKKLNGFYNLVTELINYKKNNNSIYDLLEKIICDIDYFEHLKKFVEYTGRVENIQELLAKIREFENSDLENKSLSVFLESISLMSDIDSFEQDNDSVNLMTVHAAKGLEFTCVFIFDALDEIIPGNFPDDNKLEEERRLFYVGMTRAKNKLYMTYSDYMFRNGKSEDSNRSRFISEIPNDLTKIIKKDKKNYGESINNSDGDIDFSKIKYKTKRTNEKVIASSYVAAATNYYKSTEPELKVLKYSVGDQVEHFKFGMCIVKEIKPVNQNYHVTLKLSDGREKVFMANYLNLKIPDKN